MNDDTTDRVSTTGKVTLLTIGLTALWLALGDVAAARAVSYSRDAGTVVASYTLAVGELEDADPGPSVRVYGNGRAVVHIPRYMKNAGDYSVQLSDAEMNALMDSVSSRELLTFDPAKVRQAKAESLRFNRGGGADGETVLFEVTDPSVTTIQLRVTPEGDGGGAGQAAEVTKSISWSGLENDEKQFPDVRAIQKLSAAKNKLRALMERPDLQPID